MSKAHPDTTFLTQRDLERRWRLSGRTLVRWRSEGNGPPWTLLGGTVRYRLCDVRAFEARQRHGTSTERGDAS